MGRFGISAHAAPARAGVPIPHGAEPALVRLVAEGCDAVGVAAPAGVNVSLDHDVRVSGRTIVIGAPLAVTLSGEALRAAVAHAALRSRRLDRWLDRRATTRIRPFVADAQRRRVLLADARCAGACGVDAAAAWIRTRRREEAFAGYWIENVEPVLAAGFRPPVLEGWRRFRSREAATGAVAGHADGECFAFQTAPGELEGAALRETYEADGRVLVELPWERVGESVWLPRLRAAAETHAGALADVTAADLRRLATAPPEDDPPPLGVLRAALAVALADAGWQLDAEPGLPLRARNEDYSLVMDVEELLEDSDELEWERLLEDAGLEHLRLAPKPAPAVRARLTTPHW